MIDKVFHGKIKKECEAYDLNFEKIYNALSPHNEILKYVEQKRDKRITPTRFRNHIQFTLDAFLEINDYMKDNSGYIMLSKRCKYILKQLDYYLNNNEKINPKMKNYFDEKIRKNLPTKSNILAIALDNLKKIETDIDRDHLKSFISNIFNYGNKFNDKNPYWKIIRVESLKKTIRTSNRTELKRKIETIIP